MWDSVSFYLRRDDIRVFSKAERHELIAYLRDVPQTLTFIKSGTSLDDFLRDLPASMEFVRTGRQGTVAVGLVRRRLEVPDTVFAAR
jgi:hypothetical protein